MGLMQDRSAGLRRRIGLAAAIGLAAVTFASMLTPAAADDSKKPTFIFLGNATSEPFWQRVIKGYQTAADQMGFEAVYRAPGPKGYASANEMKAAVENAIASKPDGLIIADSRPEAVNDTIKQAVAAGIPVVLSNSGFGQQDATGALAFVGLDETNNGKVGGELLKATGAKHALVVTLLPGIPDVDNRTAGFIEGFAPGQVTKLEVAVETLYDTTKLVNSVLAALQKDETIDSAFSIGSCCSPAMLAAKSQLGDRGKNLKLGTIDLGDAAVQGIIDGNMAFGLDQQQFMQGYLPGVILSTYLRYGIIPATKFFPTGPGVVNADNAKRIVDLSKAGIR